MIASASPHYWVLAWTAGILAALVVLERLACWVWDRRESRRSAVDVLADADRKKGPPRCLPR